MYPYIIFDLDGILVEEEEENAEYNHTIDKKLLRLLRLLKKKGCKLAVISVKPTMYLKSMLAYFQVADYFDVVVGCEAEGRIENKDEVLEEALTQLYGKNDRRSDASVIVGNWKVDVETARRHHVKSVAFVDTYGELEALQKRKPDRIVMTVAELRKTLLPFEGYWWEKVWNMIMPVLLYLLVVNFIRLIVGYVLAIVTGLSWPISDGEKVPVKTARIEGIASAVMQISSMLFAYLFMFRLYAGEVLCRHHKEKAYGRIEYTAGAVLVLSSVIAWNLLFCLTGFLTSSQGYADTSARQYMVPLSLGILLYGCIAPLAEEFIFRGILYNRMKYYLTPFLAGVVSSAAFGIYHQNPIQAAYGFLMGCLFVWLYERFDEYNISVYAHGTANLTAYLLTYYGVFANRHFVNWSVCIGAMLVMIAAFAYLLLTGIQIHDKA